MWLRVWHFGTVTVGLGVPWVIVSVTVRDVFRGTSIGQSLTVDVSKGLPVELELRASLFDHSIAWTYGCRT